MLRIPKFRKGYTKTGVIARLKLMTNFTLGTMESILLSYPFQNLEVLKDLRLQIYILELGPKTLDVYALRC